MPVPSDCHAKCKITINRLPPTYVEVIPPAFLLWQCLLLYTVTVHFFQSPQMQ
jgi:hypothetical protein